MLLPMAPTDSLFLLGESRENPMHVGGLAIFTPPDGASATDMRAMFDIALTGGKVAEVFRKRARRSLTSLGQWGWETSPTTRSTSNTMFAATHFLPRAA